MTFLISHDRKVSDWLQLTLSRSSMVAGNFSTKNLEEARIVFCAQISSVGVLPQDFLLVCHHGLVQRRVAEMITS